eukprot:7328512-Prorocentrum_lima.AAC.1
MLYEETEVDWQSSHDKACWRYEEGAMKRPRSSRRAAYERLCLESRVTKKGDCERDAERESERE